MTTWLKLILCASLLGPCLWGTAFAEGKYYTAFIDKMKSRGQKPISFSEINLNRKGKYINASAIRKLGKGKKSKGPKYGQFGFTWEKDDAKTLKWFPQGITGLRSGKGGQRAWLAVSWYDNEKYAPDKIKKGARITFVDVTKMKKVRYRHVLLVEPVRGGAFVAMQTLAGGLAYQKGYLYVAGTDEVLVFDTTKVYRAHANPKKNRLGFWRKPNRVYALDYRYIMPMVRRYTKAQLGMTGKTRLSCASVDYSTPSKPLLVMGNFHKHPKYSNKPIRVCRWSFGKPGHILSGPKDCIKKGLRGSTQGGAKNGSLVYLATSGDKAKLWVGRRKGTRLTKLKAYPWAFGTEDLHVTKSKKRIWSLTEWPPSKSGHRIVFAVKLNKYKPKR